MNLKKSIAIALTVAAAFASFGCGGGGQQSGSSASVSSQQVKPLDEATIKKLVKQLASSKLEDRKAAFPVEKLPMAAFLKTVLKDGDNTWGDVSQPIIIDNLSVSNIKQSGDYASAQASFTVNNQQFNRPWIFRKLDGKWVFDFLGIKTSIPLKVSGYDSSQLEVAANFGYTYENDPVLLLDVRSKTAAVYKLGLWSQPSYILVTDKGEFPVQDTATISIAQNTIFQISSAQPFRFCLPFKGATGKPKALRITGFNELDSRGFSVGHDDNQVVTFTLSE